MNRTAPRIRLDLSAAGLHVLAMGLMLLDHLWATIVPGQAWMTCLGRLAFPIFAFLLVEGAMHTSSRRRYALRLTVFALLSEIPFDLMYSSQSFYPYHQNVLWTLLLGLGAIAGADAIRRRTPAWLGLPLSAGVFCAAALVGTVTMTDYFAAGVLTIGAFYLFRGPTLWHKAGLVLALYWIHVHLLGGLFYPVTLFGVEFELVQQGLALLALFPIWLYHGRQGIHSRAFRLACYGFYPVHMLFIVLLRALLGL